MKTASMLFGLVVSTAGIAHASPRVDGNGDVACGNVMSKSADDTCTVRTAATKPAPHKPQIVAKPLVQAVKLTVAQPLADANGDMTCGNVMSKGGRHHVCHEKTAAEAAVDPILTAFYAPPAKRAK